MKKTLWAVLLAAALPGAALAQVAGTPPAGRLLASNCFQCHGTNGRAVSGFEKLAGMSASELKEELGEMKMENEGGIMGVHAAAYTDAQIAAMASYFASVNSSSLKSTTSTRTTNTSSKKSKSSTKSGSASSGQTTASSRFTHSQED